METGLTITTVNDLQTLGKIFYESKLFPDLQSQAQAVVKVLCGREMGFGDIYSLTKIYIVKG
ncbi:hypothetical protein LCGC14_3127530, partial [marine sediment metagenome]